MAILLIHRWREFATRAYYEVGFATQLARRAILYTWAILLYFLWRKRPLVPSTSAILSAILS
ncbi:hypothetical protein [Pontibacter mucosus]|uniref:hypothetical protein n=1 Tax=Pontibacter mucosus TaxID=1649266 RepID=UPI0011B223EE|nr:hypothetical protein [Pontibacter mucosus]